MQETSVGIGIGLAVRGLSQINTLRDSLRNMTRTINEARQALGSLDNARLNNLQENLRSMRSNLTSELAQIPNALKTSVIAVPIKLAIDDEAAFANVKKYVDDSEENLLKLKNEMRGLSSELGESFENIANIASGGGKINLAGEDLVKYTRLLATGSTAFEMSAEQVATAANNMKVGFKLDKVDELKEFFDVVNLLDNKVTNAGAADILTATSLTAGNANLLGLNEKAASAIAASMLSTGKAPSVVGTSLNSLYTRLANIDNQGKKFHEALATIGLDAKHLKTAIGKDAAGAVTLFLDRIAAAPKELQAGLLYDLMGGNFSDEIAGLITNMDAFKANMKMAFSDEAAGSMQKELQVKLNTAKSGIQRLMQAWRNLGSSLGETFLPLTNSLASMLSSLAKFLSDLSAKFPTLTAVMISAVAGLMLFKPVFLIVRIAALSATDAFITLVRVLRFLNPVTMIARARTLAHAAALKIQAAATWLVGARLRAALILAAAWNTVVRISTALSLAFGRGLVILRAGFTAAAIGAKIMRLALISTGIGALVVAIGAAGAYIVEHWDEVKEFFLNFWEKIKTVWDNAIVWIKNVCQSVADWFNNLWGSVAEFFKEIWQSVANFFSGIWQGIAGFLSSIWQKIYEIAGGFIDAIMEVFRWAYDSIVSIFTPVANFFKDIFMPIADFLKPIFNASIDFWSKLFGGFFDWVASKFQWIVDTVSSIGDALGAATDWTKDALGIGDGKEANWYNPFSWFNDDAPQEVKIAKAKDPIKDVKLPAYTGLPQFSSDTLQDKNPNASINQILKANEATPSIDAKKPSGVGGILGASPGYKEKVGGAPGAINVTFTGDFRLFGESGKFDLENFKAQITRGVKEALKRDEFNSANTEIREQR